MTRYVNKNECALVWYLPYSEIVMHKARTKFEEDIILLSL